MEQDSNFNPVFDIPSTFMQGFNKTNLEQTVPPDSNENGDKNPTTLKTITCRTENTRNDPGRASPQHKYDESVVPPEYREQFLWDELFGLDDYYNYYSQVIARAENHDTSAVNPERISLDSNNFTPSDPPLQAQSSEQVQTLQNHCAFSANPTSISACGSTETNAVALIPSPQPPPRTNTGQLFPSVTLKFQAIRIGTYNFTRNTNSPPDRCQPAGTFSKNGISFVIPHSKLSSTPVTLKIPMRCIGKVEASYSGELFPALFIHLSDPRCTNYVRNLLGFGYHPTDADYHFHPESADLNQSRITFIWKTDEQNHASNLQDILTGQIMTEINYSAFLTVLHESAEHLKRKQNSFSLN